MNSLKKEVEANRASFFGDSAAQGQSSLPARKVDKTPK